MSSDAGFVFGDHFNGGIDEILFDQN